MSGDLSIWEGDGLLEFEDWWELVNALDMTVGEIEGWIEGCKREAWVHEKMARYEEAEYNVAVARYFWRRAQRLREFYKQSNEQLDSEAESAELQEEE